MMSGNIFVWVIAVAVGVVAGWMASRSRVTKLRHALRERDAAIVDLKVQAGRLETALEQERAGELRLSNAFKALSADALKSSNESFLELAKMTLEKYQEGAKSTLDEKSKSVEEFVKPLKESLEKVNVQIEAIEKTRREDYGGLAKHLDGLRGETSSLHSETRNLTNALRKPVVRGRWGEIQLRNVVEMAGMLEHCDFDEQPTVAGETGRLRPDLIVKYPGGKCVVVDAKAPLEAFLQSVETSDEAAAKALLHDHARQVRAHVVKLGTKSYWAHVPATPEFIVMFLPGENFFAAAIQHDPELIADAARHDILIASPSSLLTLLRSMAYGWTQEKLAENAQEIKELGVELFNRMRVMAEHIGNVGKGLNKAVVAYNNTVASLEERVLPSARRFPDLGVTGRQDVPHLAPVELTTRAITSPELTLFTHPDRRKLSNATDSE